MSLQYIIDSASKITPIRPKTTGIQYSRDQREKITYSPNFEPWTFIVEVPPRLRWTEARPVIESLDQMDRYGSEIIEFHDPCYRDWFFKYQGDLDESTISSNFTLTRWDQESTYIDMASSTQYPAGTWFRTGDLIQIGNYPYPLTVVEDAIRITPSFSITIKVDRRRFIQTNPNPTDPLVGSVIRPASEATFRVICRNMPTYTIIPGGSITDENGDIINNALVQWEGAFEMVQVYEGLNT